MRILYAAAALLAVAGCVTTQATRLGDGAIYAPVSPHRVAIYRTAEQVRREYIEVALITASGDHGWTNEEQMYKKLRERAGSMGANGLILDSLTEPTTGAKVANFFLGTTADRRGKVVAIRTTELDMRPVGTLEDETRAEKEQRERLRKMRGPTPSSSF